MDETFLTKVIVLAKEPYREADARVHVYSQDRGRMNLVIRGALKSASRLSGHLEPLNGVEVMVIRGRRFDYVGGAKNFTARLSIKASLDKIRPAWSALYVLDKITPLAEPDPEIYFLLKNFFDRLEKGNAAEADFWLDVFIWKLCAQLGLAPALSICPRCGRETGGQGFFSPAAGGVVCSFCRQSSDAPCSAGLAAWLQSLIEKPWPENGQIKELGQYGKLLRKNSRVFANYHLGLDFF